MKNRYTTTAKKAGRLSPGMMELLTGTKEHTRIQERFVAYCESHPDFISWQSAWKAYKEEQS